MVIWKGFNGTSFSHATTAGTTKQYMKARYVNMTNYSHFYLTMVF